MFFSETVLLLAIAIDADDCISSKSVIESSRSRTSVQGFAMKIYDGDGDRDICSGHYPHCHFSLEPLKSKIIVQRKIYLKCELLINIQISLDI